jgi:hypothetical protein
LASQDGEICALADDPAEFAEKIIALIGDPEAGRAMAERARQEMMTHRDIARMTSLLVESYRAALRTKRSSSGCEDRA